MVEIKKKIETMKFDDFVKIGLKPKCILCKKSNPKEMLRISCEKYKDKIVELTENLYKEKCDSFETDLDGILTMMSEQKPNEHIKYRNIFYKKNF